jgi:hypothetical protein
MMYLEERSITGFMKLIPSFSNYIRSRMNSSIPYAGILGSKSAEGWRISTRGAAFAVAVLRSNTARALQDCLLCRDRHTDTCNGLIPRKKTWRVSVRESPESFRIARDFGSSRLLFPLSKSIVEACRHVYALEKIIETASRKGIERRGTD